ncbi:MAG: AMP-dependent synthetase, partial [Pseudonocardiaceae bacterium]|nr:AMP-dependent synthetase [Pseudonocardiaceae bacterium]
FPGVAEAAVAGLPSTRWGEEVAAWLVPRPATAIDTAAALTHCRERLAPYKCPKQVFVVAELPRNAVGKVVRSELSAGAQP